MGREREGESLALLLGSGMGEEEMLSPPLT